MIVFLTTDTFDKKFNIKMCGGPHHGVIIENIDPPLEYYFIEPKFKHILIPENEIASYKAYKKHVYRRTNVLIDGYLSYDYYGES